MHRLLGETYKKVFIAFLLIGLLLIAGCISYKVPTKKIKRVPINVTNTTISQAPPPPPKEINLCQNIVCGPGESCDLGICSCSSGYKTCGNACIPTPLCCTDSDCTEGTTCANGVCNSQCSTLECSLNQVCSEVKDSCICAPGTRFCKAQGMCIPSSLCCGSQDCPRDFLCEKVLVAVEVCLEETKRACKVVKLGGENIITLGGSAYNIKFEKVTNERLIFLTVDESSIE